MINFCVRKPDPKGNGSAWNIIGNLVCKGLIPALEGIDDPMKGYLLMYLEGKWRCTDDPEFDCFFCDDNYQLFERLVIITLSKNSNIDTGLLFRLKSGEVCTCTCESRIDMWGDFEDPSESPKELTLPEIVSYYTGHSLIRSEILLSYNKITYLLSRFPDHIYPIRTAFEAKDDKALYNALNDLYWDLPDNYNIINKPEGFMELLNIVDNDDFKDGKFD